MCNINSVQQVKQDEKSQFSGAVTKMKFLIGISNEKYARLVL
jgi:hypothetical protein